MADTKAIEPLAVTEEWIELMPDAADLTESAPGDVQLDIARRIMAAPTAADVLAPQELTHARDVIGVPLLIQGARWQRSEFEGGPGVYAVIEAVHQDTGEVDQISCGGKNVLAQLYRLGQLKAFPVEARFMEARKPTANGYRPLWLQSI